MQCSGHGGLPVNAWVFEQVAKSIAKGRVRYAGLASNTFQQGEKQAKKDWDRKVEEDEFYIYSELISCGQKSASYTPWQRIQFLQMVRKEKNWSDSVSINGA